MAKRPDEENFEEAESQAYRAWSTTTVPYDIQKLFNESRSTLDNISSSSPPFYRLLWALREFTKQGSGTLPLSSTLPDMKSDTNNYIHLQKLYKDRAEEEKETFKSILKNGSAGSGGDVLDIEEGVIDEFVKNAHLLRVLKGEKWGVFDQSSERLGKDDDRL
jgi:amyloid beta precursor protein binding protein 1